jgi:twitching motility protein PilU
MNLRAIVSQRLVKTVDDSRVAAVEILLDSPRVKDLILKGQITELKEAMEKSTLQGMQSFDQALYNLYKANKITLDEALKNADSANNVRLRVKLSEDAVVDKNADLDAPIGQAGKENVASKDDNEQALELHLD